jgi:hypothetical protein
VYAKNPTKLSPSDLVIYANKEVFERKDDPLQPDDDIKNQKQVVCISSFLAYYYFFLS